MVDENINDEQKKVLEAKEIELKKREQELKVKEDAFAKEQRKELEQSYKAEAEAKKVSPQDISKLSDETVEALISQLKIIEAPADDEDEYVCPECDKVLHDQKALDKNMADEHPKEKKKKESKGKVDINHQEQVDVGEDFKVTMSEFGSGYALYKESYDPVKYKILSRNA